MSGPEAEIAVVVTVKDDPRVVDCVEAILAQDVDFDYDVVVVDNGSTDETPELLGESFGDHEQVHLTAKAGNLSEAWNEAARSTQAGVIVRIDADAEPLPGWLEAIVQPLVDGEADWTAGPVEGVHREGVVARYFHHRTESYCQRLAEDEDLRDAVPSWNVAYRRQALAEAGWYDPWQASSVDWDLHKRLARAGARGRWVTQARARHHHPGSLRAFARKQAWYATGQYQMALKYGFATMAPAFTLAGAYAGIAVLLLAGVFVPTVALVGLGLWLVAALVHAASGLREGDGAWYMRPVFRPIEAAAAIYGVLRGLLRYGLRSRPVPEGEASA